MIHVTCFNIYDDISVALTSWRRQWLSFLLTVSDRLYEVGPGLAPEVVANVPTVVVDAQLAHVDVGDAGHADQVVDFVDRLQSPAHTEAVQYLQLQMNQLINDRLI